MKNKRKSCGYKVRYADKEEAEVALRQLARDFLYSYMSYRKMFAAMKSYRCKTHDCYHLGHRKNKKVKSMNARKGAAVYAVS